MIPQAFITEWRNKAPWAENYQVEQDLVIERALVEIYTDPFLKERLAFRGGTALHKLHLSPQARYSEDIDLVQINSEPIKDTLKALRERLAFVDEKPMVKQKANNNTILFRYESEDGIPLRLKVETNCKEHFTVNGIKEMKVSVNSQWFKGEAGVLTYDINEMLGTKLRAEIYERLISEGNDNVIVLGDLNDTPDSAPLQPLLADTDLNDISDHPTFDTGEFAGRGTFGNGSDKNKIDYLLLSPPLFERITACGLFRKGAWPGKNPKWTVYDELQEEKHVASDHHVVWCEID